MRKIYAKIEEKDLTDAFDSRNLDDIEVEISKYRGLTAPKVSRVFLRPDSAGSELIQHPSQGNKPRIFCCDMKLPAPSLSEGFLQGRFDMKNFPQQNIPPVIATSERIARAFNISHQEMIETIRRSAQGLSGPRASS